MTTSFRYIELKTLYKFGKISKKLLYFSIKANNLYRFCQLVVKISKIRKYLVYFLSQVFLMYFLKIKFFSFWFDFVIARKATVKKMSDHDNALTNISQKNLILFGLSDKTNLI